MSERVLDIGCNQWHFSFGSHGLISKGTVNDKINGAFAVYCGCKYGGAVPSGTSIQRWWASPWKNSISWLRCGPITPEAITSKHMAHQHLYDAAITTIRNEHLLGGRSAKLRRFCDFNGIEPSGEFLHALAGKTLFEKIRRKELQSEWDNPVWPADRAFTRRSIAGSYNDEMPPDVLAAFVQRADPSFKVRLLITGLDRGCQPISLLQRRVVGTIVRHRSRKERMEFGVVGANHAAYRRSSSCQSDESFFD